MAAFEELGVLPEICDAVTAHGWKVPTGIQSEVIPAILGGCDVFMAAETGSGKTGAFCIPALQMVWEAMCNESRERRRKVPEKRRSFHRERPPNAPYCVIIEPTLELVSQTHSLIDALKRRLASPSVKNTFCVGAGKKLVEQEMNELSLGEGMDVLTSTIFRFKELVIEREVLTDYIRFFILDEADYLALNCRRFIYQMYDRIPRYAPTGERLQMIVCSATLHSNEVKKLKNIMHFPQWIDLRGRDAAPDTVHHVVCLVDPLADQSWIRLRGTEEAITTDGMHRSDRLYPGTDDPCTLSEAVKILKGDYLLKAIREHNMEQCIIFCRTKLDCNNLETFLKKTDPELSCACMHGDRTPRERYDNLEKFKSKQIRFLICTDVVARGIDVHDVPYAINMTLPPLNETHSYLHRIGRIGHPERMGLAISFVATVDEKVWFHICRSRGLNCQNTDIERGCALWYRERECLRAIERHLEENIPRVGVDLAVPVIDFDGKLAYGTNDEDGNSEEVVSHAKELKGVVDDLVFKERLTQWGFLFMTHWD
ncbi:hypothetical protein QR680_011590 [Steinernema hermaphroditum]|uniref:ATP-dependent RNA helicase n=1 Tax=Steinernema hermaphroditum TaxID=289476 RepID=A0AA39HZ01_9BILA|nr:hypothetical protein QR680_011590 [Steinernema hermaphroditum]